MISKKNIPLIIALAIPALMIVLVACFIYLPGIGQHPSHNFVYMTGNNSYYGYNDQEYTVSGNHLVQNIRPTTTPPSYYPSDSTKPHFYLYNIAKNNATEITFQEAQSYTLDSSDTSSDGYTIAQGNYSSGDFFFGGGGGGDYNSWFVKGHNRSWKLNLKLTGTDYYNFQFLGWIEN